TPSFRSSNARTAGAEAWSDGGGVVLGEEGDGLAYDDGGRFESLAVGQAGDLHETARRHGVGRPARGCRRIDDVVFVRDHQARAADAGIEIRVIGAVPGDVGRELPGASVP